MRNRALIYFPQWKKFKIEAGITTRAFPLYLKKTDELDLAANRKNFKKSFPFVKRFVYLQQVHGAEVLAIEDGDYKKPGFYRLAETDGAITNIPGLALLAMTADCLSIFLRAPGWVGVVHAGWRGTQKEITKKALALMREKSGRRASEMHLIFGPSICGRHYEVGKEFENYFPGTSLRSKNGKYYFNLVKENKSQILDFGVPSKNISASGFCTISENKSFYSFRAEKESAGRMVSFIRLTSGAGRGRLI